MRSIQRRALPANAAQYLARRQAHADQHRAAAGFASDDHWKSSRQTIAMTLVLQTLHTMTGPRRRCMYCMDSEGGDIEHFRPKARYPERMYQWPNMLLCCTLCGRLKGGTFPLSRGRPLLVDPTQGNPWEHMDFDPVTGNLSARFDLARNAWSPKGLATVGLLQLDRREAVARGYLLTLRRLSESVHAAVASDVVDAAGLIDELLGDDDHGLLGWCFSSRGAQHVPFRDLCELHPVAWRHCQRTLGA